jgi:AcrR family transcriptional regulator
MIPREAPPVPRVAREPQRQPGRLRVAALLRAGAEVIAEHGFEAATMAEIATRAGAPIGSLYRFFPNKNALADALMQKYRELIDEAFARIEASHASSSVEAFADALLFSLSELRGETQAAVVALIDARSGYSAERSGFTTAIRAHVVRALQRRAAHLDADKAENMARILVQNMKMMKSLRPDDDAGAIAELRAMTRLYLANQLGD